MGLCLGFSLPSTSDGRELENKLVQVLDIPRGHLELIADRPTILKIALLDRARRTSGVKVCPQGEACFLFDLSKWPRPASPGAPLSLLLPEGWSKAGLREFRVSLEELSGAGVNHVALNLRFNGRDVEETLRQLAGEVLPAFTHR